MDPGDPKSTNDPHNGADDDDTGPGWARAVGESIKNRGTGDRVDCVPTSGGDHRKDNDQKVTPVAKAVSSMQS